MAALSQATCSSSLCSQSKVGKFASRSASSVAAFRDNRSSQIPQRASFLPVMAASTGDKVSFSKYHGLGNDFVLVDNRSSSEPCVTPEQAVKICDRNFGVGGDGVIFALPPTEGDAIDYTMRIYNSDGSEPEMCGNGIRCLARFVADLDGKPPGSYRVNTLAGLMIPEVRADGQVAVDMGEPFLVPSDVPTTLGANSPEGAAVKVPLEVAGEEWLMTCVGMGNPHAITFGTTSNSDLKVDELPLETLGPLFECNEVFPAKTNTEFVEIIDRGRVKMRVWERGAGLTLACGTGACATVVAGVLEGRLDRECVVELPGGPLEILWRESDNHIIMTGPAEGVFAGDLSL